MVAPLSETHSGLLVQNDAFRQEYSPKVNPNALKKDVESYLGEYRFQVQKYQYEFRYGISDDGKAHLTDIDDREPMINKARRAIERRVKEGKKIDRELAELQGLINLEQQLLSSRLGDQIVWMSPPGLKSDGYGDYGFVFLGKIDRSNPFTQEKHLEMAAVRVEKPTIEQYNLAFTFLTGYGTNFSKAENFLANPVVASNFFDDPEYVLAYIFNLAAENKNDLLFQKVVPLLKPQIEEFINLVNQGGSKIQLVRAFQAIELYALDLKEFLSEEDLGNRINLGQQNFTLSQMIAHYKNQAPPAVAGSCGNTNNTSSQSATSNIFNKYSALNELFSEDNKDPFVCPKCGYETSKPVGNQCPNCHLTKEEAANQGYNTC